MGLLNRILRRPPQSAEHLGRNEKCWCGSGKKYKHCHYDQDRKYFAGLRSATCTTST